MRSNTIKNLLSFTRNYKLVKNTFKGIGSCEILSLSKLNDFEKLVKYYLVWCKINSNNENSYSGSGTINYVVNEYIEVFEDQKIRSILSCSDKVSDIIQNLKHGWSYAIEIIVAYDTSKSVGLIVDGTSHALALYYLSLHK